MGDDGGQSISSSGLRIKGGSVMDRYDVLFYLQALGRELKMIIPVSCLAAVVGVLLAGG